MRQRLIQVEDNSLFYTGLGMRQIDYSLLDLLIFDGRQVLKETYRLENVNRELPEDRTF